KWLNAWRMFFAVLCLGGAIALAIVTATVLSGPIAASTAGPCAMLFAGGFALLAPAIVRPIFAAFGRAASAIAPRSGWLARRSAGGRRVDSAAAVAPIMLVIGLATALLYMQTAQDNASERALSKSLRPDLVLSAPGGVSPGLAEQAA